jgi:hypothetical protein
MPAADLSGRTLTRLLVLMAGADLILFAYHLRATSIRLPYWDMFTLILRYLQYRESGDWWSYVWAPHVQHHQVWMRLLTALDAGVFGASAYPFIVFTTLAQVLTLWLLWRATTAGVPRDFGLMNGSVVVLLLMTAVAAVDCATPITGVYPQTVVFAVLALVLFDPDVGPGVSDTHVTWQRIGSLFAAVGASFGNAAALSLWPILVWLAWRAGALRLWVAVPAVIGTVFIFVYVRDLPLSAQAATTPAAAPGVHRVVEGIDYLLTYLGLPLTRAAALAAVGQVVGAALLAVAVGVAVWIGILKRTSDRPSRLAVGLILFSLATALLAAIGRLEIPEVRGVKVPVRYSVFVAPLHVGLLLAMRPILLGWWADPTRRRAIQASALALASVLLVLHVAIGRAAAVTARSMTATIQQFMNGERTPDMARVVYSDVDLAARQLAAIRAAGLYLPD